MQIRRARRQENPWEPQTKPRLHQSEEPRWIWGEQLGSGPPRPLPRLPYNIHEMLHVYNVVDVTASLPPPPGRATLSHPGPLCEGPLVGSPQARPCLPGRAQPQVSRRSLGHGGMVRRRLGCLGLFLFNFIFCCVCVCLALPLQCYVGALGESLLPPCLPQDLPLGHQPPLWTRQRADGAGRGLGWCGRAHRPTDPLSGHRYCPVPF